MTPAEIISDFRFDTAWTSTSQVSDAQALRLLNKSYRTFLNRIKSKVKEGFFYQEWYADTVQNQSEYALPIRTASVDWCDKLISVSVKYSSTDTEHTQLRADTIDNLTEDLSRYKTNQPKSDAFFIVNDLSYWIFPAPTEVVTEWIKLYGIKDPIELTLAWVEASVLIPIAFHDVLIKGMKYWFYSSRWLDYVWAKNDAKAEFYQDMDTAISQLSDRIEKPMESYMPYLANLW